MKRALVWLIAIALLWWALRLVPLADIWNVLRGLSPLQIGILLLVNSSLLLLFAARWWLILRTQGYHIPYLTIARYRLAAFGVSYFTPGPHFGGEPLQVYYLRQNHRVPTDFALAAVSLDKIIELIANFGFLLFGLAVAISSGVITGANFQPFPFAILFLLLPLIYLTALWMQRYPLTWALSRFPSRLFDVSKFKVIVAGVQSTEQQVSAFCRQQPGTMLAAFGLSAAVWAGLVFEYWLALRFLGLELVWWQLIVAITAARLSLLTPIPAALGVLEAGQVLALSALGFNPAYGISIGVIIRARDVFFGLLGLWWGAVSSLKLSKS